MAHRNSDVMGKRALIFGLLIVLAVYAVTHTAWTRASRGELEIHLHAGDR